MAQRSDLLQAAFEGKDLSVFQELTEDEHIDDYKDSDGNTLLSIATRNGHKDLVKLLLAKDASISTENSDRKTPIFYAAENGYKEIVELLLKSEKDFDRKSFEEAVSAAASKGHADIVKLVLENFHSIRENSDHYAPEAALSAAAGGHSSLLRHLIRRYKLDSLRDGAQMTFNRAAAAGHKEVVRLLLGIHNVDINGGDESGNTALYLAVQACHKDVVALLLKREHININAGSRGRSAFSAALGSGREDLAEMLLARGGTDKIDREIGHTVLHHAVLNGDTKTVQWLLTKDEVDINAKNIYDITPLYIAVRHGHTETVKLLLAAKEVNVNAGDHNNKTPLHMAVNNRYTEIVKLLLATKEVNVNIQDYKNKTPLAVAVNKGHAEIVKLLLESDGAKNCNVTLLLCIAAKKGYTEIAKLLLTSNESNINAEIYGSATLLHIAAENGHTEMVKSLLETDGINVNAKTRNGKTPLFLALKNRRTSVIALLLARDDFDLQTAEFLSGDLIHWAAETGQHHLMDLVLARECNAYPNRTPLTRSSENGHLKALECLLKRDGIDVNSKDSDGRTPLSWAAEKGHGKVVEMLLRYSADGNFKDGDGRTPLSRAAGNEHEEVVKQLTPHDTGTLLLLTKEGNKPAIEFILRYKPNLEQKDCRGQTALHLAVLLKHRDIAKALMLQGVNVNSKDDYDMTPLKLAMQREDGHLIQELLAFKAYPEGITGKKWRDAFGKRNEDVVLLSRGPDGEHHVNFPTTFLAGEELLQISAGVKSRL